VTQSSCIPLSKAVAGACIRSAQKLKAQCIHETLEQSTPTRNGKSPYPEYFFIFTAKANGRNGSGRPFDTARTDGYSRLALQKTPEMPSSPARRSQMRAILTDIQFWAPFLVLLAGLALLVVLR
jgi:hypothetical protein